MKNLISWKSTLVAAALAVLWPAAASAQAYIRVDVPFAFTAGNRLLPAGEYVFVVDTNHMTSRIYLPSGLSAGFVNLVPGVTERPAAQSAKGMVRFQRYGEKYILTGIWRAGWVSGNEVSGRRHSRELASGGSSEVVETR